MSVKMSVKNAQSRYLYLRLLAFQIRRDFRKIGVFSSPVDDTLKALCKTLKLRWISLCLTCGRQGITFGVSSTFESGQAAPFAPSLRGFHVHMAYCQGALLALMNQIYSHKSLPKRLFRICRSNVSPSSLEVFRPLRRDVMTVTALLRIRDVEARLAVPRSTVYNLIKSGALERVYIASSPRIVDESVDAYIDSLRRPALPTSSEGSN
jgi:predicted DNA-binding transcriptional regulator AlpA